MTRFHLFAVCVLCACLSFFSLGCPYDGPHYPTIYGVPTATATPSAPTLATISYGGSFNFSPAAVTISAGGTVIWDATLGTGTGSHTLYVDNGSLTSCTTSGAGYPATISFPTIGTFQFHCSYHTGCGTSCSGCAGGMQGIVVVQ